MAMCIFVNCNNVQKAFSSLTFFGLPEDERRRIWIAASGNQELLLLSVPEQKKLKRVVCERHFDESLLRKQFHRTTLFRHAIPKPWQKYINDNPFSHNFEGKKPYLLSLCSEFECFVFAQK